MNIFLFIYLSIGLILFIISFSDFINSEEGKEFLELPFTIPREIPLTILFVITAVVVIPTWIFFLLESIINPDEEEEEEIP